MFYACLSPNWNRWTYEYEIWSIEIRRDPKNETFQISILKEGYKGRGKNEKRYFFVWFFWNLTYMLYNTNREISITGFKKI